MMQSKSGQTQVVKCHWMLFYGLCGLYLCDELACFIAYALVTMIHSTTFMTTTSVSARVC